MKLRRIHLFEIEDQSYCPSWLRDMMTSMIVVLHRWFGVAQVVADEIRSIATTKDIKNVAVIDLCSGAGGPMPEVLQELNSAAGGPSGDSNVNTSPSDIGRQYQVALTDLYPNQSAVERFHETPNLHYCRTPIDASQVDSRVALGSAEHGSDEHGSDRPRIGEIETENADLKGSLVIRTMVCSFHHMPPKVASAILKDAQDNH